MDLGLAGKQVFISGSTAGIGLAVAKAFLKEGAAVLVNGRKQATVDQTVALLQEEFPGQQVGGAVADFTDPDSIARLIDDLPLIDILINNVGIYTAQSFYEATDADWTRQVEVNLMSGVRLSRALLPKMLERDWGRIQFISSECASLVPEDLIAYSTTKAALHALSRGLAQLCKGSGVTVNTFMPGSTMTEGAAVFLEQLAAARNTSPENAEKSFFTEDRPASLLERFADVAEIANTLVYFASPLSSATNGAVIKLEGGSTGGSL
ncbi:NAD(P)-dependent dehydrogenase, short-chain alcohol dehydrogenase family [Robiginitalea myxolifaciens]|uniref:NAD(P)-dependent dehydrogenase, short-chain alcohol dehydrogenase family n=1 Tax=Robiginitalea myxolifaciens TaxID=400055 RepID=A0A1I6HCK1_9FLAO|nr:SDR family oxidoreductase [Robiginitalea myxolifaciens]SFR52235.1 NAD(P)-dependent dehydrogenase, short-chain alcohol dehydrogenase family [Robiginitalea myxolifaciens]